VAGRFGILELATPAHEDSSGEGGHESPEGLGVEAESSIGVIRRDRCLEVFTKQFDASLTSVFGDGIRVAEASRFVEADITEAVVLGATTVV